MTRKVSTRTNCVEGTCDNCGTSGKFAWCVAPKPHHLHACPQTECLRALQERVK